ncbi:hypothetical protein [Fusibacter sp. JL216-2]|uniref:hypothetical protein n=1 Tax=Fusibacter sp. JL216-2 TaxID=3071453 RepID=UPI003D353F81
MSVLQDILITNKLAFKKSTKAVKNNPGLLVVGAFYMIAVMVVAQVAGLFGIFGGLIMTLFQSAVFSNYLFLMNRIVRTGQFTQDDFQHGFKVYFRKVWVVLLIIWVAQFAVMTLAQPFGMLIPAFGLITLIAQVVAFVLFNPLPETLYQKHLGELDSFMYAFSFIRENWIDWFVPNIVLGGACYGIYRGINLLFATTLRGLPFAMQTSLFIVLIAILVQAILGYMMVYRGFLFEMLSTTTRRKRLFMRHINRD